MTFRQSLFCCWRSSSAENFCKSSIAIFLVILVLSTMKGILKICLDDNADIRFFDIISLICGVIALMYSLQASSALDLKKWDYLKTYSTCMLVYMMISFVCKIILYLLAVGYMLKIDEEEENKDKDNSEELRQVLFQNMILNMILSLFVSAYYVSLAYSLQNAVQYLMTRKEVFESKKCGETDVNSKSGETKGNNEDHAVELPKMSLEPNEMNQGLKDFI